ncbi:toprim domain-containing protein [Burkholderia sp. PU8-34]
MARFESVDQLRLPLSGELPDERIARAIRLAGTAGQAYVEHRGIPLAIADAAGMRFDPEWDGRPAVLIGLYDREGALVSVHGRYLTTVRGQNKMLTVGRGGGVASVGDGWHAEHLILVEGIFDALSLAVCGWPGVATIGRWAPWLPQVCARRAVWLGFDANAPGDRMAAHYTQLLPEATMLRLLPPPRCKDWNTALVKRGPAAVARWLRNQLGNAGDAYKRASDER